MAVASLREMKDQALTDSTNDDIKIKFIEESKKEGQKNYEAFQKREEKNKKLQEELLKEAEIKKDEKIYKQSSLNRELKNSKRN